MQYFKKILLAIFWTTCSYKTTSDICFDNQPIFVPANKKVVEFCKKELQTAFQNSSPALTITAFLPVSGQESIKNFVKKGQFKKIKGKVVRKVSEEQVDKKSQELLLAQANRACQKLLTSCEMLSRACSKAPEDKISLSEEKVFKNRLKAIQDLRFLSSTNDGLKSVLFKLFGANGLRPLSTPFAMLAAGTSLALPTTDLQKLTQREKLIAQLVDNEQLLTQAKGLVERFAHAQAQSYGLLLNPEYVQPFDQAKHGSIEKWKADVGDKVFSVEAFEQFTGGLIPAVAQLCTSTFSALALVAVGTLFETINRVLDDRSADFDSRIEAYIVFLLLIAFAYVPLHFVAVMPTFDVIKKRLQKVDKFLKIKPSAAITANIALAPLLNNAQYTEYWFFNMIARHFSETLLVDFCWKNVVKPRVEKYRPTSGFGVFKQRDCFSNNLTKFFPSFMQRLRGQVPSGGSAEGKIWPPKSTRAWLYLGLVSLVSLGVIANFYLSSVKKIYNKRRALAKAHKLLCNFKNMITTAKELETLFFECPATTQELLEKTEFGKVHWSVLNSKLFDSHANYSVLAAGQIIATTAYLSEGISTANNVTTLDKEKRVNLDQVTPLMVKMGEVELLVAVAEIIVKSKGQKNQFCLPNWIKNPSRAHLKGAGVWHPLIEQNQAVANDFDFTNGCTGIIATGGNSTGKTIGCCSVVMAACMAQALGFAPASEFCLKPFDRVFTQIGSTDDPGKNSLFRAQISQLLEMVAQTKESALNNQSTLVYLDESLSGTKPKYADAIFKALVKRFFAQNKHCTMIFATHLQDFPVVVKDLSNDSILPVKVACQTDSDGHFVSSDFRFESGVSNLDTAFNVLSEEADKVFGQTESQDLLKDCKQSFARGL